MQLVYEFCNPRRQQLLSDKVRPNEAHSYLAKFEHEFSGKFLLVTQNGDNLHERAGSDNLIHMHGELLKMRCLDSLLIFDIAEDFNFHTECRCCLSHGNLRPHIVWFGEPVPLISQAIEICKSADSLLIIGTSLQVYPAASLVQYVPPEKDIFYIDPKPIMALNKHVTIISEKATTGVQKVIDELTKYN